MLNIISNRKIWFSFSGILLFVSLVVLFFWGLKLGIDFTGGSLLEIEFSNTNPTREEVKNSLEPLELGYINIQKTGESGLILRFKEVSEETHQEIVGALKNSFIPEKEEFSTDQKPALTVENQSDQGSEFVINPESIQITTGEERVMIEKRFESVGPTIGAELKQKSIYAMLAVLGAIVIYVAWAFRRVSRPITSWKYGLTTIVTLFHDVLIVVGVFVLLGHFFEVEVDTSFVAALLTILGYSVNDTIVIFDRIRENLSRSNSTFSETINKSVNQSITRSVNTSLTTLLVLLAIFFFGGVTIKYFVLALTLGVIVGTYSSIFIASPLLVVWNREK